MTRRRSIWAFILFSFLLPVFLSRVISFLLVFSVSIPFYDIPTVLTRTQGEPGLII